jgi:hypothetical protein
LTGGFDSDASFRRSDTSTSSSFSTMSWSTSRTPTPAKNSCTDQAVDNLLVIKRKKKRKFVRLLSTAERCPKPEACASQRRVALESRKCSNCRYVDIANKACYCAVL